MAARRAGLEVVEKSSHEAHQHGHDGAERVHALSASRSSHPWSRRAPPGQPCEVGLALAGRSRAPVRAGTASQTLMESTWSSVKALIVEAEEVGFEPAGRYFISRAPWPRGRFELRFVHTGRDRSSPARTGGSRCRTDPARTPTIGAHLGYLQPCPLLASAEATSVMAAAILGSASTLPQAASKRGGQNHHVR